MTASNQLSLPSSSFGGLKRIIIGYSHLGDRASLNDLAHLTGIARTRVSGNNRFLTEINLISGGRTKTVTPLGTRLGRALEHKQLNDARLAWQEAVGENEKLAGLVTTVRLKQGMTADELVSHTLYVSGQKSSGANRTGARAITDILLAAGLLEEREGKLQVASSPDPVAEEPSPDESSIEQPMQHDVKTAESLTVPSVSSKVNPTIAINIQLQLPETENAEVYEKLFSSLRKHLMNHDA